MPPWLRAMRADLLVALPLVGREGTRPGSLATSRKLTAETGAGAGAGAVPLAKGAVLVELLSVKDCTMSEEAATAGVEAEAGAGAGATGSEEDRANAPIAPDPVKVLGRVPAAAVAVDSTVLLLMLLLLLLLGFVVPAAPEEATRRGALRMCTSVLGAEGTDTDADADADAAGCAAGRPTNLVFSK
jgi:hypothetical protein